MSPWQPIEQMKCGLQVIYGDAKMQERARGQCVRSCLHARTPDNNWHFPPTNSNIHLPMHSTTVQTKHVAKADRRPIGVLHAAIATLQVSWQCLDSGLVGRGHLHHGSIRCVVWSALAADFFVSAISGSKRRPPFVPCVVMRGILWLGPRSRGFCWTLSVTSEKCCWESGVSAGNLELGLVVVESEYLKQKHMFPDFVDHHWALVRVITVRAIVH